MIKLISVESNKDDEIIGTIFADTKAEVPAKGEDTVVDDMSSDFHLGPASIVYTASLEVGVLDSSDNWNWS